MMRKLMLLLYLILIMVLLLEFGELVDEKSENNFQIINHGIVDPKLLSIDNGRRMNSHSEVHVSIRDWILKAHRSDELMDSSNFSLHWMERNESIVSTSEFHKICGIHHGHVDNNKNSRVVMTICDVNFYIFFQLNNRSFTVNPLANGSHILEESRLQSLIDKNKNTKQKMKRDLGRIKSKSFYNLTGDTFSLGDDSEPINVETASKSNEYESQNYFSDHTWMNSKFPRKFNTKINEMDLSPKWLELGIAVDYSVIQFHGERVQQYIIALFNIVNAIYRDPSLNANLMLVIVRIIFYAEKKDGMVRQGNAKKSLENVNKWNRNVLSSSNKDHDVAVWLTRLDIGGPSGYAPVSGVCDPARSCALNRDEGLTSAFIIAHELAHILGLTHDGDETADNFCGPEATMGSIMAPMVAATFHRFHWSTCSKEEYHRRLKQWACLSNYSDTRNVTQFSEILHDSFTMDEQCRMEFGDGYELCRTFDLPGLCSHLWCSHRSKPQVCKTKKGPPLEGTTCGKDKWCVNGYCKPTGKTMFELGSVVNAPKDGGWSQWSLWSKCSTTCGVGVQLRSRLCSNSAPIYNGENCKGSSHDIKICNQHQCPTPVDLRREQCNRLSNSIINRTISGKHKFIWLPLVVDDKKNICRLTCKNSETNHIYVSDDFLIDGTRCSYDSSNICIQGKCHLMGCDNVLNSAKRRDACGLCDGNNSTCTDISSKFQRKIRRANTRVAFVPAGSYNINIQLEIIPILLMNNNTKFIVRDGQRRKYEMKYINVYESDSLVIEGTEFRMEREFNVYNFLARGPTMDEVVISLYVAEIEMRGSIASINVHYVTNREKKTQDMNSPYSWFLRGWGPCTVTCGSGIKRQMILCKNNRTGKIENKKKCLHIPKPIQEIKPCNILSCQFKWITTEWKECTKTCGSHGIQQREIYCIHSSFPDDKVTSNNAKAVHRAMLPQNICQSNFAPKTQRDCNRVPCRGEWVYTEWSTCSRSCGQGTQSRMARCVSTNDESLFNCDGKSAPNELRPCKGCIHELSNNTCAVQYHRDKSHHYCTILNLKRYCRIAEFRKYCCRTCSKKKFA